VLNALVRVVDPERGTRTWLLSFNVGIELGQIAIVLLIGVGAGLS
jgi:hypothetical protein